MDLMLIWGFMNVSSLQVAYFGNAISYDKVKSNEWRCQVLSVMLIKGITRERKSKWRVVVVFVYAHI